MTAWILEDGKGGKSKSFKRGVYSNDFEILGDKLKITIISNGFYIIW